MQLARIIGTCTATVKHPTLSGWRLLVAQPLDARDGADGDPVIMIDRLGCGRGDKVMFTSDGNAVRELMDANDSPMRYAVIGLADDVL